MQTLMTTLLWIELGSLHALRGLLRGFALSLGMTVGFSLLALFWAAGALGGFLDSLTVHAKTPRPHWRWDH